MAACNAGPLSEACTAGRLVNTAAWLAIATPFALLLYDLPAGRLGANPIEEITLRTGMTAFALLAASLAITPLRKLAASTTSARQLAPWIAPWRRRLGLSSFAYACLHAATWFVLDHQLDSSAMLEDIAERRFATAGMVAFACLCVLAATSSRAALRRLGGPTWRRIHRLAYAAGVAAGLHFLWLSKGEQLLSWAMALLVAALLATRLVPPRRS
jgi:sulfoxide reductase heme-binding subunit YedZ